MRKTLFVVLMMLGLYGSAQNKSFHVIELLPNETETLEQVDFYIEAIIDNRIYKDNVGIAQKGAFNRKVLAKFSRAFDKELMAYLQTVFPKDSSKVGLTLRINQLLISENTGAFKETGKAIVSLDVLKSENDSYGLLGSFSSLREKNSMDVTRKHDDRIRGILKDCLMEFNALDWQNLEPKSISIDLPEEPLLLSEAPNEGFFKSFTEFYKNISFKDSSIEFKDNKHRPHKLFLAEREHKRALYYAYSDGKDIFINAANYSGEKHFVKTHKIDRFLLFNDAYVHQEDVGGMSLAFGVLGVLGSNKQTNVLLDLYSGQYHVINSFKARELLKEDYPSLYKSWRRKPNDIELLKSILEELFRNGNPLELRRILKS